MDIRKLQRAIVDGLEDVKAQNIAIFNTEHLSPLFERVIIASGTSNRQTKALASSVRESVKKRGMDVLRTEGEDNGEWIIVDCGAAVAHIMQPAIRDYYHLEEIWGGKAVKMKLADGKAVALPKASEDASAPPPRQPAAKAGKAAPPARKAAAKKAPARKAPGRAAPGRPAAAGKAPARHAVAKKAALKQAAPKQAAPKKPAAKQSAAKKPAARKTPARRP
ncbi:MAG: ribosome silencing factor [Proteobacteria bacterium]|nr:ribosome silencing factor [Pseudomonadota bacterium]